MQLPTDGGGGGGGVGGVAGWGLGRWGWGVAGVEGGIKRQGSEPERVITRRNLLLLQSKLLPEIDTGWTGRHISTREVCYCAYSYKGNQCSPVYLRKFVRLFICSFVSVA